MKWKWLIVLLPIIVGLGLSLVLNSGLVLNPIVYLRADVGSLFVLIGFGATFILTIGEIYLSPTSMLFRNLMAMDTEEMILGQPMDGVVLLGGCDKTLPAQLMGAASADRPAIVVTAGPMLAGRFEGSRLGACTDCRRFWAEHRAGDLPPALPGERRRRHRLLAHLRARRRLGHRHPGSHRRGLPRPAGQSRPADLDPVDHPGAGRQLRPVHLPVDPRPVLECLRGRRQPGALPLIHAPARARNPPRRRAARPAGVRLRQRRRHRHRLRPRRAELRLQPVPGLHRRRRGLRGSGPLG